MEQEENQQSPSFGRIVMSVLAAAIGVQTDKNRERDFHSKSIMPYIVAGILFTAVFMGSLILIVKVVLNQLT